MLTAHGSSRQEEDPEKWVDKLGTETGNPKPPAVYVVNETLYQMIQAGWDLNSTKYRLVTEAGRRRDHASVIISCGG